MNSKNSALKMPSPSNLPHPRSPAAWLEVIRRHTVGDLFAGVGGFALGASWAGFSVEWACEVDPWKQEIYRQNHPTPLMHGDIHTFYPTTCPTVIAAGFPCQDTSRAGRTRNGLAGARTGLWTEALRIISNLRPPFLVLENTPDIRFLGADRIAAQLAQIGYSCMWRPVSCREFGLPHIRKRWICIAHADQVGRFRVTSLKRAEARSLPKRIHQTAKQRFNLVSETYGHIDRENIDKAMGQFMHLDDGLPPELLSKTIAAVGDSVSPIVAYYAFLALQTAITLIQE